MTVKKKKKILDQNKIAKVALMLYGNKNIDILTPRQRAIVKACVEDKVV